MSEESGDQKLAEDLEGLSVKEAAAPPTVVVVEGSSGQVVPAQDLLLREPSLRSNELNMMMGQSEEEEEGSPSSSNENNLLSSSMTQMEIQRYGGLMPFEKVDAASPEKNFHSILDESERVKSFLRAIPVNCEVYRHLGSGQNGMVFAAKQLLTIEEEDVDVDDSGSESDGRQGQEQSERNVAIKVLSSQRTGHLSRKLREATPLTFLPPHSNIVKLLSRPVSSQTYEYFIMELCDLSLAEWIEEKSSAHRSTNRVGKASPTMNPPNVVRMLYELCDVVVLLRKYGVTHRDIKPANVLLKRGRDDQSFTVKLADFGVADMSVGGVPTRYKHYVGSIPEATANSIVYTSEDDFRAAVACVYFAWIGEADWQQKRLELFTETGFTRASTELRLNGVEWEIMSFFERALPTMEKEQDGEMLSLDEAVKELEKLGKILDMNLALEADKVSIKDDSFQYDGSLNDRKLNAYCSVAFDYATGRRKAADFKTALDYLNYAEDLFGMFDGEVPVVRRAGLSFQKALVFLPKVQTAVREYMTAHRDTKLGKRAKDNHQKSLRDLGKKCERSLRQIKSVINEGLSRVPDPRDEAWDGPGRSQFVNVEALACLEEAKYYMVTNSWKNAESVIEAGLIKVETSLDSFLLEPGGEFVMEQRFEHVAYQHRRNRYLLQHEQMKMDKVKGCPVSMELAIDAIECCRRGVGNIHRSTNPSPGEVLEMSRCYAEALCIGKEYGEARFQCETIYDKFGTAPENRVRIARVLALWIIALRELKEQKYMQELGFVCGVLTNLHILSAKDLCRNIYFVPNARAFLSADAVEAFAFGGDPLMLLPVIPSDETFIRKQANIALRAVNEAVAEIEESADP